MKWRARSRRPQIATGLILTGALFLAGCQTTDLKPFATASAAVVTSINQGGDLAVAPLLQAPVKVGGKLVLPGAADHPARKLQEAWEARRKTADALLAYSASLAAIADASAHRKSNAAALVRSVNDLATAVPGASALNSAAGNLTVKALETVAEVKAFHDLSAAVKSADPAVQAIAKILRQDFGDLAKAFQAQQMAKWAVAIQALAPIDAFCSAVSRQRDKQRLEVAAAPSDTGKGAELARLDALLASAEPELTARRAELNQVLKSLATGKAFFAAAESSLEAWAAAHHDIAAALEEKRLPSLVVLATRAQELHALIDDLKPAK